MVTGQSHASKQSKSIAAPLFACRVLWGPIVLGWSLGIAQPAPGSVSLVSSIVLYSGQPVRAMPDYRTAGSLAYSTAPKHCTGDAHVSRKIIANALRLLKYRDSRWALG